MGKRRQTPQQKEIHRGKGIIHASGYYGLRVRIHAEGKNKEIARRYPSIKALSQFHKKFH